MRFWSNLKTWQKGAIIGAVWGIVSGIVWFILSFALTIGHAPVNELTLIIGKTIFLPGYLTFILNIWISENFPLVIKIHNVALLVFFILAVVFGAIIGGSIGYYINLRREEGMKNE
jgi:branched-subunit amino acid ABC-type transport system permease component